MRGKRVKAVFLKLPTYVFIVALFFLVPLASSQTCGNGFCEFNSDTFSSGISKQIAGHSVSVTYLGQGIISVSVDGSAYSSMGIGDMLVVGNVPVRVVDIIDASQQAEITIGENIASCNQDCFGTYEIPIVPPIGESYSNPDIDCSASANICAVAFEDIISGHIKSSYFNYSHSRPIASQQLSSSDSNYEPRVSVGSKNAFVEWIQKIPSSSINNPHSYNILGSLITSTTKSSAPLEVSNPQYPNPKSLHGSPVYVPSIQNFVSYWTEALYSGKGTDVIGRYVWEGSYPPANNLGQVGAFYNDSASPPSNSKDPYMIYTGANELVLIWSEENSTGESDMMMQFFPASGGAPIQGSFMKFDKVNLQSKPMLAKGSNFIAFFEDSFIGSPVNILSYVQNQLIAPSKPFRLPINPVVITLGQFATSLNYFIHLEDVAYNPATNEYVVVWTQSNPVFFGTRDLLVQGVSPAGTVIPGKQVFLAGYIDPSIAYTGIQNAPYVISSKKGPGMNSRIVLTFLDPNLMPKPKISTPLMVPIGTQRKYTGSKDTITRSFNVTRTTLSSVITAGLSCQFNPTSCPTLPLTKINDGDNVPIADDIMLTFTDTLGMPRLLMLANFNDTHADTGNFSTLKIESNANSTAIDHSGVQWQVQKLYLAVPNSNNGAYVLVCPDAKTLPEVVPGCTDAVEFTNVNNIKQTKTASSGIVVTAQLDDTNTSYFIGGDPLGLPGTGATTSQIPQTSPQLTVTAESGKGVGEQVKFTASYLANSGCTVWFTVPPQTKFSMVVNSSNPAVYEYNTTFVDPGTYYATFECKNALGDKSSPQTQFSISATSSNLPTVILDSPSNNAVLSTASVTFRCIAQAVQPNKIGAIDLFIDGKFMQTNTTLNAQTANATFIQSVSAGSHTYNCLATDRATTPNKAFGPLNFTFTVNTGTTLRPCASNDWTCSWTPSDISCQKGSTQTYKCDTPPAGTCSNPDPVKPVEATRACAGTTSACADSDYENATWSACSASGIQTGTRKLKDGVTCSGENTRTETKPCSPGGDNTLLIVLVVVIIAAAAGGAFFYLHKKGTKPPKDEDTLWDDEYEKGGKTEEPGEEEYSDEDYEEDEGK